MKKTEGVENEHFSKDTQDSMENFGKTCNFARKKINFFFFLQTLCMVVNKERRHRSKETTYWSFLFDAFLYLKKKKSLLFELHVILLSQ